MNHGNFPRRNGRTGPSAPEATAGAIPEEATSSRDEIIRKWMLITIFEYKRMSYIFKNKPDTNF